MLAAANGFTLGEMIKEGWPILSVLWIMSILSITVIVDRLLVIRKARFDNINFINNVIDMLDRKGPVECLEYCRRIDKPVSYVACEIILQKGGRDAKERAAQHALQYQINKMERFIPMLGTIASTAPFIGLLGTVIGIMRAFNDISQNMGGGPEAVSAGIAEALITTAFGLFVAIPATIGFNYFVRTIQRSASEIDHAVYDLIETSAETDGKNI